MFNRKKKNRNKTRQLVTQVNPRSPISEQYRTIRTNLQFSSIDKEIRTLLVTSAGPAAGKSITAANLAIVYAQQGKKTLLIDTDLRKPTVHYTFRLDNLTGLSNVLIGDRSLESAIEHTGKDHLDVLSCGPIPPNPSELLGTKRMEALIDHARTLYDFIIFDTPPILAVTDAKILANIVDGTVFVVRSGDTHIEEAQRGMDIIQDTKAKFLGVILNDRTKSATKYNYYYGS